ncbi:hypothetical protein SJ05684_c10130 [Sinorhizobium sojae CCBAU 05684]|uniref:Uncharacterized protein n=1 Tax=Sinorhizobium sojae CCBAU 05684 TaxID=716928 RepID=A0A249P971_9HYPH|nr:hypothetical protein [Sinorhizobium sojae]ASY62471.1 hypothetical protein SJ05684_c10130 [Sinorhizobium sojae CCBAU 05684]
MTFSAKLMVTLEEKDAEIERLGSELSTSRRTALQEAARYHDEKVAEIWNADPEQMTDAEKTARGVAYSVHIMAADAIRKLAEEA